MKIVHKLLRKNGDSKISQSLIDKQRRAVKMAYQIMVKYPEKANKLKHSWSIYRHLRGVMLADEVGIGKTYEALALATVLYLKNTRSRKGKFRVLILAAPAIQSKWQWCSEQMSQNLKRCSSLCPLDCRERDVEKSEKCTSEKGPDDHDVGIYLRNIGLGKRRDDVIRLFSTLSSRRIRSRKGWQDTKIAKQRQAVFIGGLQSLKRPEGRNEDIHFRNPRGRNTDISLKKNYFDLIIADEAHIARTGVEHEVEGKFSRVSLRKIKALLNGNPDAKLILLTATPFQNNAEELKRLLEPVEYGPRNDSHKKGRKTVVRIIKQGLDETIKQYSKLMERFSAADVKGMYRRLELDIDNNAETNNRPKQLKNRQHKQVEGLDDYLRDVMIRNKKDRIENKLAEVNIVEKAPAAAVEYLFLRDAVAARDAEVSEEAPTYFSTLLSELVSSEDALRHSLEGNKKRLSIYTEVAKCFSGRSLFDLKRQRLLDILSAIRREKRITEKRIVTVFCYYTRTIDMLKSYLLKNGIPVHLFTGADPKKLSDRKKRLDYLAKWGKKKFGVLLVSQVGNEGLDFNEFSNTIIHYDGHFNPAVIDQRNGRVYRNNTKKEEIRSYRLQLGDTYDERVTGIEMEKRIIKDFFLGDKELGALLVHLDNAKSRKEAKAVRKVWREFAIDLEPKTWQLI